MSEEKQPRALGTLTAAEASALERRMQLEDPAKVEMPGGGTLKEFIDRRDKNAEERAQAARDEEAAAIQAQAPPLPDVKLSVTEDGHILTTPQPPKEVAPESKAAPANLQPANLTVNTPVGSSTV